MNKSEKKFITFLGIPLNYDILRAWIRSPFTLDERETKAYKQFVKDHGYEHSDFGWFFEVYWKRDCQLARSEIEGLIKLVDEMEIKGVMLFPDLSTEELKAILDDIEKNIPDYVGIEIIYGKIREEYHCRTTGKRIPAPTPIICYESNLVFDIDYFLNDLQNDSYFLWNQMSQEEKNEHYRFTSNDVLFIENHLRYMTKQLMDKEDGPEFFEVFEDLRTGKIKLNIEYYPEED